MGIVRCCWKLWWMPPGFEEPATGPPTGSMLGRPPDAAAWTGSTKATVKPSKTSMSIRWSAIPGDTYAAIPLKTFQVVAATNSFTRAAAGLGHSHSNVTMHIQALERELGASTPHVQLSLVSQPDSQTQIDSILDGTLDVAIVVDERLHSDRLAVAGKR